MEVKLLLRGFAVGALAGLLAFLFARIFAEPVIQTAIDYESGRDAAQEMLDKARGIVVPPGEADPFSRGVQRGVGIGTGLTLFGVALGGFLAVAYAVSTRYSSGLSPRQLALRVAAAGFLVLYLVPFLKYPANPPAIGHEETIGQRSALYMGMVVTGAVALGLALWVRARLRDADPWLARGAGTLAFVVVVGIVMLVLPPLGHLDANVAEYGRHASETPLPLRDARGTIVFPGFPADDLFEFRLYSIGAQGLLWGTLGLGFGLLAERLPAHVRRSAPRTATPALA